MISPATEAIKLEQHNATADFDRVWAVHRKRIQSCCYKWLNGDAEHINDAMSQASEKAFCYYLSEAEPVQNHFSWLYKLTYNICIDIHRSQLRQQKIVKEVTSLPDNFYFSDNTSETLDEQMAREFSFDAFADFLSKLPEDMQRLIKYRFIDDMGYEEVAHLLNTSQANVRKKVQFLRQRLRSEWLVEQA